VSFAVDLPLQDFLGARNSDGRYLATQLFACAIGFLLKLGQDVNLTTEIDENLIGGAVISAGDVVIDGSLRSRLEGLSNALIS